MTVGFVPIKNLFGDYDFVQVTQKVIMYDKYLPNNFIVYVNDWKYGWMYFSTFLNNMKKDGLWIDQKEFSRNESYFSWIAYQKISASKNF